MTHAPTAPQDLPHEARDLADNAARVLQLAADEGLSLATAESCTGGLLASLLTDIEGLSSAFERGFVTYSVEAKCDLLGIDQVFVERHGVVSSEVALAMVDGALAHSPAGVAAAITGFAGKAGPDDEAGLVHLAVRRRGGRPILRECHFGDAGRDRVRMLAIGAALEMIEAALEPGD